jgi:hypothetical protein
MFLDTSFTNQSAVLSDFFNKTIIDGQFNAAQWPYDVVRILIRYLTVMYEAESFYSTKNPFDRLQYDPSEDEYWAAVRNVLEPNMATYNITIDQLKAGLQNELSNEPSPYSVVSCLYAYLFASVDLTVSGCIPTELISYMDGQSICSQLFGFELALAADFNSMTSFTISLRPPTSSNGTNFIDRNNSRPFTLDFTGRSTPPPSS